MLDAVLEQLRDRERRAGAGELVLVLGDHHVARAAADVDRRDAQLGRSVLRRGAVHGDEFLHAAGERAGRLLVDEHHLRRERLVDEEELLEVVLLRVDAVRSQVRADVEHEAREDDRVANEVLVDALLLLAHRRGIREDDMLQDARVRLFALEHAVLRAVDLRVGLAEDLDDREHHHRARRVARIGGRLRAVVTQVAAARVLGHVLEDATEDGAMLAAAVRAGRDLTDLLREVPALVGLGDRPRGSASGPRACTGSDAASRARDRAPRDPCARRSATGTSRRSRWGTPPCPTGSAGT